MLTTDYSSSFKRNYDLEVLGELPSSSAEVWYYPGGTTQGGRDGMLVSVRPRDRAPWIGVFGFGGFGGGLTLVSSLPDAGSFCAVSNGAAYIVRADDPASWSQPPVVPITSFEPLIERGIVLLADYTRIAALGISGILWRTEDLSWDGITIKQIGPTYLDGEGWDPTTAVRPPFRVDLNNGRHEGGSASDKYGRGGHD